MPGSVPWTPLRPQFGALYFSGCFSDTCMRSCALDSPPCIDRSRPESGRCAHFTMYCRRRIGRGRSRRIGSDG
jgi:hypothetical protein